MRFIDLSKPIENNANDPWFMRVKIKHKPHKKAKWLLRLLGLPKRLFPSKFEGWADDKICKMGVHSTTHLDAPWHYAPMCEGKRAKSIDEVPLEWCYGEGVVIDMSHKEDLEPISAKDLEDYVVQNRLKIDSKTIVLIKTGRDKYIGTKEYAERGTGVSAEATRWILDHGVKVAGIDQWGWDLPLKHLIAEAKSSNDKELFWEGHLVGVDKEYCHLEQLVNLDQLPMSGFKVALFPLKIVGASAAPCRVVAMIDD